MATQFEPLQVDFLTLAVKDPEFGAMYERNEGFIDFKDPEALKLLTKSTLKVKFDLQLELPDDRLCPPVPVRSEYIRWIQSLLDTTSEEYLDKYDPDREVVGIDIGVGASCIYPLLGCVSRPRWRFGGTEIDEKNLEFARRNVQLNNYESRIRVRKAALDKPLIDLDALGIRQADFVMCNPPFFASKQERDYGTAVKAGSPSAVCTGADVEMICHDGELGFVSRMLEESKMLRDRVQWYSSMFGKLGNVYALVDKLNEENIKNWAVTGLRAGNVTRRWAIAWSYGDLRPSNDVARGIWMPQIHKLPYSTHLEFHQRAEEDRVVAEALQSIVQSLDVDWHLLEEDRSMIVLSKKNVWSRAARRQKAKTENVDSPGMAEDGDDIGLGVKIRKLYDSDTVTIRWLQGVDAKLFESFCGMLKREVRKLFQSSDSNQSGELV